MVLCNRMLPFLLTLDTTNFHIKQIRSLFYLFTLHTPAAKTLSPHKFTRDLSSSQPVSSSSVVNQNVNCQIDLHSVDFCGIVKSVISKCSRLLNKNEKTFANTSVKSLLFEVSDVIPEVTRKFWRVSELKIEHVLEILLAFQSECVNAGFQVDKVRSLWEIFKRANEQKNGFKHLPQSCEAIASLLFQVKMLDEAEVLLSIVKTRGILLGSQGIFESLIGGYVNMEEFGKAISIYDRMRGLGLIPSRSCYVTLLKPLVELERIQVSLRISSDMVNVCVNLIDAERTALESTIRLLCIDGKIQEARNLVKKVLALNVEISGFVLDDIAIGYCEKKDFEDLLSFFVALKRPPPLMSSNRIIHSLCCCYGTEKAINFMQNLEHIGFIPNEITYGILIGWSCREGKLKNALAYLSLMLSKRLNPQIYSCNALISGLFKEGMWKQVKDVLEGMIDGGTLPDISTFRVLLAGYCKARQFDEVKRLIHEMVRNGFIQLSSSEDPVSKAFMVLGFKPLAVRLKRDNYVGLSKAEFFDNLGNGLYLDTDLDEYDRRLNNVLMDSMLPDFESFIRMDINNNYLETALVRVNQMFLWGQELSLPLFSELVTRLCSSPFQTRSVLKLLDKLPLLAKSLDEETLNLIVQTYIKKGFTCKAQLILDKMLQNQLQISNETYTSVIMSLCKKRNSKALHTYFITALRDNWTPRLEHLKHLVGCFCDLEMTEDVLELLKVMLLSSPHLRSDICQEVLKQFCATGSTDIAFALLEEIGQYFILDKMSYSNLIRRMYNAGKFSGAFILLEKMLGENMAPCLDVSILLIPHLCKAGKLEKAIALKDIVSRDDSSFVLASHSALMNGFSRTRQVEKANALLMDMLSKGILPDSENYETLLQVHCQAKDLRQVSELLCAAIRKCTSLSISSYRNVVRLLCMEDMVLHALRLKEVLLGQRKSDCLVIYNILIFYLFASGNILIVSKLLDEMEGKGVVLNEVTYNFLVYGFLHCKDLTRSMYYLHVMMSKQLRPSNRCLRMAISSLCNAGEFPAALELSQEMETRGWSHGSTIQYAITVGFLSRGRIQEAEEFVDRMSDKSLTPENINYDSLIKLFCHHGRLYKGVELMNIMLKKRNIPDLTSYDVIICGFCEQKNLDTAMNFHAEMLVRSIKPSIGTWEMLVHNLCQEGRTIEAEDLITSMVQGGQTPSRQMYNSVISRYRQENNLRKGSDLMEAMQKWGYETDFETHWSFIDNLRSLNRGISSSSRGFLSRLLSGSGFSERKGIKR